MRNYSNCRHRAIDKLPVASGREVAAGLPICRLYTAHLRSAISNFVMEAISYSKARPPILNNQIECPHLIISLNKSIMQKITPFLWFDNQAEEAVKFYTSIFKDSKIGKITRYGEAGEKVAGRPSGSVMTIEFEVEGQKFTALNGGPQFKFNESISFVVNCG